MSDNYSFMKSSEAQSIGDYSPYQDKQANNYINDLNNGVYTNNSLSLVNFDLGAIYNSQKYTDTTELSVVIPITMVAAFRTATGLTTTGSGASASALCSIKTNFLNLIHQADLQINGKTVESTQPFLNVARNFQMLSEMSTNDLATIGPTILGTDHLDTYKSMRYSGATSGTGNSGNGMSNNRIYGHGTSLHTNNVENQSAISVQNNHLNNTALQFKHGRYIDTSANTNNLGAILTTAQLNNEFRPYYTKSTDVSGSYHIWYDYAVIKLGHIFESLNKIGLVKRFDATVRLWINTGTVNITIANPRVDNNLDYSITAANNTFSNTCPLMLNYLGVNSNFPTYPSDTSGCVAGLYIAKPPVTSFNGINLGSSGASHPLQNCRLYYPQITLQPEKSIIYAEQNRNKKVVYRSVVSNIYTNLTGAFNALVNAGIVHPTGVLVCPFISNTVSAGLGDYQWKSPFDSAPFTTSPCSLTNFNVKIGGTNVLQSTLSYTYEHFLQQVNLAEQLTSADFGVSTGLIHQDFWQWSKFYYCNVERSALADKLQPRNVNISFNNNSNVAIDVLVFIFYSDELTIDVETGIVNK
jgi:hypothetical protein